MNDSAPVSRAKAPLPQYKPAPIHDQVAEVRKQLAITRNVLDKKVAREDLHPATAAIELQRLQSALNTLEAIEKIVGPDAALSGDELRQRLAPVTN